MLVSNGRNIHKQAYLFSFFFFGSITFLTRQEKRGLLEVRINYSFTKIINLHEYHLHRILI